MKKMMKNFSRLVLVTFAALSISFAFTSCGSDDDGDNDNIYVNGGGDFDQEISGGENADGTVSLTVNNGIYVAKWTLTFDDNDLCTRAICECTFSSREFANAFAAGYGNEVISQSGNKVTINQTSLFQGEEKADVLASINAMQGQ